MKCKCMSTKGYRYLLLLLLLLAVVLQCTHYASATLSDSAKWSNCYDSYNGFDNYPSAGNGSLAAWSGHNASDTLTLAQRPFGMDANMPDSSGWRCCCWGGVNQNECRCEGGGLTRVPQTLKLPIQTLTIASVGLPLLRSTGLKVYGSTLLDVTFTDCMHLAGIQDGAFANLTVLRTIYISHAPKLSFLSKDVFEGISETIEIIRIINSGLKSVPDLTHLPPRKILQMIDLDNNQISRIDTKSIKVKTAQLILANNDISYIDDSAFYGSKIAKLSLKDNQKLKELHSNAFFGIIDMTELDLSSTSLVRLPSAGLQTIEALHIENTHTLKTVPSIYYFQNLQRAYLTHSFHCCAFQFPSRHDPQRHAQRVQEMEKWREQCHSEREKERKRHASQSIQQSELLGKYGTTAPATVSDLQLEQNDVNAYYSRKSRSNSAVFSIDDDEADDDLMLMGLKSQTATEPELNSNDYMSDNIGFFHEQITINPDDDQLAEYCGNFTFRETNVECYPMPNPLNPCEDVMGYQWLRIAVWIVVGLAVVGNVAVLTVILLTKNEPTSVPRFLMCHLAFADLCLGLYLLLIACIDAHSMGAYFNYAYDWQYGAGCRVAGFLTVFASHLSVFTLTVITIERWLAITHALYLNKRIKLRPAACIMSAGWVYSIIMSSLPLLGISNYSSTSICLPMEIRDTYDTVYLVAIMGCNGVAFSIIAICYAQIYLSLGSETRHARQNNPGDMSIAKKMALLVFTNFTCWAPIAFFGLTALAGYPLINVTKSKILLVFFYPLNSCADPYLYAILTSQYRQDLFALLSKLGLCRQSALKYKHSDSMHGTSHFTIHGSSIQRHNSLTPKMQKGLATSTEKQSMLKNHEDYV